jgi:hypothetical protein
MQDDQIGTNIVVLGPVDMARLLPSIITQNILSSKQPSLSAGTTYTFFEPALLYKENCLFVISTFSFWFLG